MYHTKALIPLPYYLQTFLTKSKGASFGNCLFSCFHVFHILIVSDIIQYLSLSF